MKSTTTANTTTKNRSRRSCHSDRSPATQITTSGGPSSTSSSTHMLTRTSPALFSDRARPIRTCGRSWVSW